MLSRKNHSFPPPIIERLLSFLYGRLCFQRNLKEYGGHSYISPFAILQNMDCISVGRGACIGRRTLIQAIKGYAGNVYMPEIRIGDQVYVGNGCTISSVNSISIGSGVTIGDNVYIADGRHGFEDINERILSKQPLVVLGRVNIGESAWIGYGSFIAGDIQIGTHSVVGANSVVTKSVPPYTVVVGAPAKVIKQYNFETSKWISSILK